MLPLSSEWAADILWGFVQGIPAHVPVKIVIPAKPVPTTSDIFLFFRFYTTTISPLSRYSEYCLDDSLVRPSDALYIMGRSITQTKLGREVSLKFLMDKWDYIREE